MVVMQMTPEPPITPEDVMEHQTYKRWSKKRGMRHDERRLVKDAASEGPGWMVAMMNRPNVDHTNLASYAELGKSLDYTIGHRELWRISRSLKSERTTPENAGLLADMMRVHGVGPVSAAWRFSREFDAEKVAELAKLIKKSGMSVRQAKRLLLRRDLSKGRKKVLQPTQGELIRINLGLNRRPVRIGGGHKPRR